MFTQFRQFRMRLRNAMSLNLMNEVRKLALKNRMRQLAQWYNSRFRCGRSQVRVLFMALMRVFFFLLLYFYSFLYFSI